MRWMAWRMRLIPRVISLATLILVTVLAWPSWFLTVAAGGRSERVKLLVGASEARDREFTAFVRRVAEQTAADESVVVIVPPEVVGNTPWYFYQTKWILAGREVYRLVPREEVDADLFIVWKAKPDPTEFEILIDHPQGALARRR